MVCVRETSVGYDLGQGALQRHPVDLLLFCRLVAAIFIAPFRCSFLATFLFLLLVLVLVLVATLSSLATFSLLCGCSSFCRWLNDLLDLLPIRRDRVQSQVGGMGERILLFDGDSRVFFELMRSKQAQDGVGVVGEDHVTRRVQLNKDMVRTLTLTESQINDTIYSQLRDVFDLFCSQVLS